MTPHQTGEPGVIGYKTQHLAVRCPIAGRQIGSGNGTNLENVSKEAHCLH